MDPKDSWDAYDQTEEVIAGGTPSEWSAYTDKLVKDTRPLDDITFRDAATFVAEMTPVVGDAMAAKDVYDELQKEEPNYYLAGALGGATIIGLVPGLGDAAAAAIKKGAREFFNKGKKVLNHVPSPNQTPTGSTLGDPRDVSSEDLWAGSVWADEVSLTPEEGLADLKKDYLGNLAYPSMQEAAANKLKVLEGFSDDDLLEVARDLPHFKDPNYKDYIQTKITDPARAAGVSSGDTHDLIMDLSSYFPEKADPNLATLTTRPLPYKDEIGRPSFSRPRTEADQRAEDLGFSDTVYHTSKSPDDFTEFDPSYTDPEGGTKLTQDILGVHVGTPRAAAERDYYTGGSGGATMELRARTDKPFTKEMAARLLGKKTEEVFDNATDTFSEEELGKFISDYEWKKFDGSNSILPDRTETAVQLRKDIAEQGFTHIPYTNNIEDPGSTSFIMLTDRPKDSPAVLRDARAEFNPDRITSGDLRFAEGGLATNQGEVDTMNKMYKEGGLATDGMDIDPVSGNEIPTGSNAVDVRDDVDAKLSEGEYVVPADVVKYFGVSYFEKLRNKAKEGLEEMKEDGRVGGDPVEEDMEEMEEEYTLGGDLASLDGYATGGLVEGMDVDGIIDRVKAAASKDASVTNMLKAKGIFIQEPQPQGTAQQQAMATGAVPAQAAPPAVQGQAMPAAFAEGGMVYGEGEYNPANYASSYNPYAHGMGFSTETDVTGQAPGTPYKPTAEAEVTPTCPEGYTWNAETNVCMPVTAPVQQKRERDSSPAPAAPKGDPNAWMKKYDYSDPETLFNQSMSTLGVAGEGAEEEEEKGWLESLGGAAKGLLSGGLAGGLVGKFVNTNKAAQMAANALTLRDMGREDLADQLDAQYNSFVKEKGLELVPKSWRDGDRLAENVKAEYGANWSTDATQRAAAPSSSSSKAGLASRPDSSSSSKSSSSDGGRNEAMERAKANAATNKAATQQKANQVSTPTSESKAKSMNAARKAGVSAKTASKLSGSQMKAGTEVGTGSGGGTRVGPQNRGGLIQPRKKK